MEICPFSTVIGFVIASFLFMIAWGFTVYGKHLGRTEKKEKRIQ